MVYVAINTALLYEEECVLHYLNPTFIWE